ncbi:MAG: hypothetical protein GY943_38275, partial [Chloroflexi bacterium]|nr:hypothetical protein [Chloroflexota bacterium]
MNPKQFLHSVRQMLWPGIGIKRWLLLLGIGSLATGVGFFYFMGWLHELSLLPDSWYNVITLQFLPMWLRFLLPIVLGLLLILWALRHIGKNLIAPFGPREQPIAEMLYTHSRRNRGPNIV